MPRRKRGARARAPRHRRVGPREDAVKGVSAHESAVFGSFDGAGRFLPSPANAGELDFEEDLFVALRVLSHGELAALVPFLETRRFAPDRTELGGGVGDLNLSARYDFFDASAFRHTPGLAALGGVTFPTGVAPDAAVKPLATDATGAGVVQGNLGVALEEAYKAWLFDATVLVAIRAPESVRGVEENALLQWTTLASTSVTLDADWSGALALSYTVEGNAKVDGQAVPESGRRLPNLAVYAGHTLGDAWRMQIGAALSPPIPSLGQNQPTSIALSWTLVRTFARPQ